MKKLCLIFIFCCFKNVYCGVEGSRERVPATNKVKLLLSENELKESVVNVLVNLHFQEFFYQRKERYYDIIECFYVSIEEKIIKILLKKNRWKDNYIEFKYEDFYFDSGCKDFIKKDIEKILSDFFELSLNMAKFIFDVIETSDKDFVVTKVKDFNYFCGGFSEREGTVSLLSLSKEIKCFYRKFYSLYSSVSGIKLFARMCLNGKKIFLPHNYYDRNVEEYTINNFNKVLTYFNKNMHKKIQYIEVRFNIEQLCLKLLILHEKDLFFNQIEIKYDEQFKNRLIFWEVVVCDFYMKDEVKIMDPQEKDYYFYEYIQTFNRDVLSKFTLKKFIDEFGEEVVCKWINDLSKCNYCDSGDDILKELNFSNIKQYLNVRELYAIFVKENKIYCACSDVTSLFLFESVRYFLRQKKFLQKVQNISFDNLLNIINTFFKKQNFTIFNNDYFMPTETYFYNLYQYQTDIASSFLYVYDYLYYEFLEKLKDKNYQKNMIKSLAINNCDKNFFYKQRKEVDFYIKLWIGFNSKKFDFIVNKKINKLFYDKILEEANSFLRENFAFVFAKNLLKLLVLTVFDYYGIEFCYEDRLKFFIDSEEIIWDCVFPEFYSAYDDICSKLEDICNNKSDLLTFLYKPNELSEEELMIYESKYVHSNGVFIENFLQFLDYPKEMIENDAFISFPKDSRSIIIFFVNFRYWICHDTFKYAVENFKLEYILSDLVAVIEKFLEEKSLI